MDANIPIMERMKDMKYGLQLYSVRDVAKNNFKETLQNVAKNGYALVESAGFFGHTAKEVKAMLTEFGLTLCSTHTGFGALREDLAGQIAFHKTVGCGNIIIPRGPTGTKAELDDFIAWIDENQPIIEKEGLKLHYHNHSEEFLPNADGEIPFYELAKRTNILFEVDTFWAYNAGADVFDVLNTYRNRIEFIHLKDGIPADQNDPEKGAVGKTLGDGTAPVREVRKLALDLGFTMVVESETLNPSGPVEATRCIEFLKTLDEEDGI